MATTTKQDAPDTTRRTLAQVDRCPQWQRLIVSIHKAQEKKNYAGRQFGAAEMRHFGETLIGMPVEYVDRHSPAKPEHFSAYWVARQTFTHSDGAESVTYALKAIYGDDLAEVYGIDRLDLTDPTPAEDAAAALDYMRRANLQIGR
jgi:hypothetical protein